MVAHLREAFRGELTSHHPHFHPGSPAACRDIDIQTAKEIYPNGFTVGLHMGMSCISALDNGLKFLQEPGTSLVRNGIPQRCTKTSSIPLKMTRQSMTGSPVLFLDRYIDSDIDHINVEHVETTWHSLGTCAMKPRDKGGVVDERLNVFGTTNLKCVDLSICPDNLGTNTWVSPVHIAKMG